MGNSKLELLAVHNNFAKRLLISLLIIFPGHLSAQTTRWVNDTLHTSVRFEAQHLGVALVAGQFMKFEGGMFSDKADFTDAKVDFTIQVKSINTNVEMRDNDLRSEQFFDAERYPLITFKSVSVKKLKKGSYILSGRLTVKDVTKPVDWKVTHTNTITDPWGNIRTGFRAELTINRFDYHISYDETFGDHILHVAPDVKIIVDTEMIKNK